MIRARLDPDELEPRAVVAGEHRLWCAVITLALADAEGPGLKCGRLADGESGELQRDRARIWLTTFPDSFRLALDAVGIEPSWWRERAVPELRRLWLARDQAHHARTAGETTGDTRRRHLAEAERLAAEMQRQGIAAPPSRRLRLGLPVAA